MKNKVGLITLLFFFLSCKDLFIKDKEFTLPIIPYTGNELKINGYYYQNTETTYSHVLVFYTNGILFKGYIDIEDRLYDPNYMKKVQNQLDCWGLYQVENDILKFEYYSIFGNNWHTCIAHCEILNDSTFNIKKM